MPAWVFYDLAHEIWCQSLWKTGDNGLGRVTIKDSDGNKTAFYYDGEGRLVAFGEQNEKMTLLNHDVDGWIFQVALGALMNDSEEGQKPRFRVSKLVSLPSSEQTID